MIRRYDLKYLFVLLMGIGLSVCAPSKEPGPLPPLIDPPGATFIDSPMSFCWRMPLEPRSGRVQILVDASGSMTGFQKAIPHLVNSVLHGMSQLQSSTLVVKSSRVCQFSQGFSQKIEKCNNFDQDILPFRPAGDTNLHDAIRAAEDYELTFILTDGVAATGSRGSGECAAGVDAACVARCLKAVIHSQRSQKESLDWGFWVIPLVAIYDGIFYTEEPILPTEFRAEQTIQKVHSDIGVKVVVQNPRTDSNGRLVFGYQGPRALFLIVISRWTDLGRAAVQAISERMQFLGIRKIEEIRGFSSGIGSFMPVEVYPGFLNPVEWKELKGPQEPNEEFGAMDVHFETGEKVSSVTVTCAKDVPGEKLCNLIGGEKQLNQKSGCIDMRILPAFSFQLKPINPEDEPVLSWFLKGYQRAKKGENYSYTNLRLHLACPKGASPPQQKSVVSAQWKAYMSYSKTADCFALQECKSPPHQSIKNLSTTRPSMEPHRIFAFSDTLEAFYREVSQDQRSIVLANIDFCRK